MILQWSVIRVKAVRIMITKTKQTTHVTLTFVTKTLPLEEMYLS